MMADLSFKLTDDLIALLNGLNNDCVQAYTELQTATIEEQQALHRYARVSMIGASTRIENALLTDIEVNWLDTILTADGKTTAFDQNRALIDNKLSKDRERSIEEVAGCRAMLVQIYETPQDFFPLRESDLRALHASLLAPYKKAQSYAGSYKSVSNSVVEHNAKTGATRLVFETADPGPLTNTAMRDLVEWYNATMPLTPWPVAVACEFVYRFLAIHPFQDGNGRLGRGLFLLSLFHGQSKILHTLAPFLAIDRYVEKHKEEYYFVLNRCSNGKFKQDPKQYQIHHFARFMIKILHESLVGIQTAREKFLAERALHESAVIVLNCFKNFPELRLTTGKIIEQTGIPRRTVVYALTTLLEAKLIQKYGHQNTARYQLTF